MYCTALIFHIQKQRATNELYHLHLRRNEKRHWKLRGTNDEVFVVPQFHDAGAFELHLSVVNVCLKEQRQMTEGLSDDVTLSRDHLAA